MLPDSSLWLATDATLHAMASAMDPTSIDFQGVGVGAAAESASASASAALSPASNAAVFLAGLAPFVIATVEFWRRVALGLPFGTGNPGRGNDQATSSSIVITIGDDRDRKLSRGRRVLGRGAVIVALVLFASAAAVLGLVAASLLTSSPMSAEMMSPAVMRPQAS
jgi:hypothetical protein